MVFWSEKIVRDVRAVRYVGPRADGGGVDDQVTSGDIPGNLIVRDVGRGTGGTADRDHGNSQRFEGVSDGFGGSSGSQKKGLLGDTGNEL